MQEKTYQKILVALMAIIGIIAICAMVLSGIMYKRFFGLTNPLSLLLGNEQNVQSAPLLSKTREYKIEIPAAAGGFIGVPESRDIKINDSEKRIVLRGHWTEGAKPTFNFIGGNDEEAAKSLPLETIIVNKDTKIGKITSRADAENPYQAISFENFIIESLKDPIFAIFAEQSDTKKTEIAAKEIKIYVLPGTGATPKTK